MGFADSITEFDWDEGNIDKNWIKHKVQFLETEQVFMNEPLLIADDTKHSKLEVRYYCLGRTDENRFLFISFTIRQNKIRIISARPMNRKERNIYENF